MHTFCSNASIFIHLKHDCVSLNRISARKKLYIKYRINQCRILNNILIIQDLNKLSTKYLLYP